MANTKTPETETVPMEDLSYEDLIQLGFDEETAKAMAKYSGGDSDGSGLPAPQLKFNYDKEDILIDRGIKKGVFISGWNIDRTKLLVKEDGEIIGDEMKFIVVGSAYQNSKFDVSVNKAVISSNIFESSYDTKASYDLLSPTHKLIKDYKNEGEDKIVFNNILALLVEVNGEWKPYIMYLHGTAYYQWNQQLDKLGIARDQVVNKRVFYVKSKKVPTNFQPAFVMDIVDTDVRTINDVVAMKDISSPLIKGFKKWIDGVNAGTRKEDTATDGAGETKSSTPDSSSDEVDDDVEVNFDKPSQ